MFFKRFTSKFHRTNCLTKLPQGYNKKLYKKTTDLTHQHFKKYIFKKLYYKTTNLVCDI